MKRSEAIKELIETHGAFDSWSEQCEYMLSRLEAIGMLPPNINILLTNQIHFETSIETISLWEPEDEIK